MKIIMMNMINFN